MAKVEIDNDVLCDAKKWLGKLERLLIGHGIGRPVSDIETLARSETYEQVAGVTEAISLALADNNPEPAVVDAEFQVQPDTARWVLWRDHLGSRYLVTDSDAVVKSLPGGFPVGINPLNFTQLGSQAIGIDLPDTRPVILHITVERPGGQNGN